MADDKRAATALVQDAVDKGVTTVEDIHKSIAGLPFKLLEGSEFLSGPAGEVRRLHDRTIGAVYGLIRRVNQQVGRLTSELLDGLDQRRSTRLEPDRH